jgi:NitT/TauT family transport system ATP-binding protein
MAALECRSVYLDYPLMGERLRALEDVSVRVEDQEFVSILGPSGCGKSSLLNIVAGFVRPTLGQVLVGGVEVSGPARDRGVVFQEHALFPWMTVRGNIEFGLKANHVPKPQRDRKVDELIDLVGLRGFEDAFPKQLSGGMRQRVAVSRAFATDPDVVLLDEPFSALDEQSKQRIQREFARICQATRQTVLLVTHSIEESILMSDRVVVMEPRPGRIRATVDIELARPREDTSPQFIDKKRQISSILYGGADGAHDGAR